MSVDEVVTAAPRSPNEMSDREAMGLPEGCVGRTAPVVLDGHADLAAASVWSLAGLVEDPAAAFDRRWAAGSLLGLMGDPRVVPDDPPMVEIPAAVTGIGLDPSEVGRVVERWSAVGVIEPWIVKECPRHEVAIEAFALMRYPVTNLEFRRFVTDTGWPEPPTSWRFGVYPSHLANHPVWTVSPAAADEYAAWLSARTGRRFGLPTEAEWEYAASGGAGRQYPWGEQFDPAAANTVEAGPLTTTPVGMYPAGRSLFGVDDLAGNVEEYVADDYRPYPGGASIGDDLAGAGAYRVARGGSFTRYGDLTRCARRHGWFDKPIYAIGFRLVERR